MGCGRLGAENHAKVVEKGRRDMCDRFEVPGSELRGPIAVEFNRDASMRQTELIVINFDREGNEGQGMKVICKDNGDIRGGVTLIEGLDIVGHAEMQG